MITLEKAWALQGYSGYDHLIRDERLAIIEGRQYRSVGDALRAAERLCEIEIPGSGIPLCRRGHPYVGIRARFASGAVAERRSV